MQISKFPPKKKISVEKDNSVSTVPTVSIQKPNGIPSLFKPYDRDATISYRQYTYGELLTLSQSKLSKADLIKFILSGIDTSFPKEQLTLFDFKYLAMLRKLSSSESDSFTVSVQCPRCNHINSYHKKLSNVSFEELTVDALPIVATISGKECHFQPIIIKDFLFLLDNGKDEDPVALLAVSILNMKYDEAYSLIFNAYGKDIEILNLIDSLLYFDASFVEDKCEGTMSIDDTSRKCEFPVKYRLTGGDVLIRPFCGDKNSFRNEICFGIQRVS